MTKTGILRSRRKYGIKITQRLAYCQQLSSILLLFSKYAASKHIASNFPKFSYLTTGEFQKIRETKSKESCRKK